MPESPATDSATNRSDGNAGEAARNVAAMRRTSLSSKKMLSGSTIATAHGTSEPLREAPSTKARRAGENRYAIAAEVA